MDHNHKASGVQEAGCCDSAGDDSPLSTVVADADAASGHRTIRPEKLKENLRLRLKRIEGQVRGIGRMVDEDVYCDEILHQVSAIQSALNSVNKQILENHMRSCLVQRMQAGETEVVDELLVTIKKMLH